MSRKILVAVDGSDHGWMALDLATDIAKASNAEMIVLHVVPYEPLPKGFTKYAKVEGVAVEELGARYRDARIIGDEIKREAEARVRKNGLARVAAHAVEGNPAQEIVALAKAEGADMVFLGSRGLSDFQGLLIGSVSHKVMHLAPCTCVAVR